MPTRWFIALLSHGYINNDLKTMMYVVEVCSEKKKPNKSIQS